MSGSTPKSAYLRGICDGLPFMLVIAPFSLLFGVVAAEQGLTFVEAMGFNILVIAGASQFAALSLMNENAPVFAVIVTCLAINLRMAMYSAALVPHLGAASLRQRVFLAYMNVDQTYAASVLEYDRRPDMTLPAKLAYFWGIATPMMPAWFGFAVPGFFVGAAIPPSFALDFAVPIMFIALVAPMMKTLAHVAAAVTSIAVALALNFLPSGVGLLIAAACAMVVGAGVETWQERRA